MKGGGKANVAAPTPPRAPAQPQQPQDQQAQQQLLSEMARTYIHRMLLLLRLWDKTKAHPMEHNMI